MNVAGRRESQTWCTPGQIGNGARRPDVEHQPAVGPAQLAHRRADQRPHRAARAVAAEHRRRPDGPVRPALPHGDGDAVVVLGQAGDLGPAPDRDPGRPPGRRGQHLLQVGLVHERALRPAVEPRVGPPARTRRAPGARRPAAAARPSAGCAPAPRRRRRPPAGPGTPRRPGAPPGAADRARACFSRTTTSSPRPGEQQGRRQPDRPGADDDDGVRGHRASVAERVARCTAAPLGGRQRCTRPFRGVTWAIACESVMRARACAERPSTTRATRRSLCPSTPAARSCAPPPARGRSSTSSSTTRRPGNSRSSWPPPGCATPTTTSPPATCPSASYPIVGGHEGAGVVTEVGPDTHGLRGGRPRRLLVPARLRPLPLLRQRPCRTSATSARTCWSAPGATTRRASASRPPTAADVGQMCGLGTFAEITTVDVRSTVKIDKSIPLEVACLVGCGVGTGWGTAVHAGEVRPGDTVIVMGIGGIGINAVQGAAHAGASHVIAVDPVEFKREKAMELGATHTFATHRGGRRLRPQRHQRAGRRQGDRHRRRAQGRARRPGVRRDRQGRHGRRHRPRRPHRRRHPDQPARADAVHRRRSRARCSATRTPAPTSRRCCGSTRRASSSSTS